MRKILAQLLSAKPFSLSRAAKLISRFAAVDNGSSAAVSSYLQRTADTFNHLVQFHNKRSKNSDVENSPNRKMAGNLQISWLEKKPDVRRGQDSKGRGKEDRKAVNGVKDLKSGEAERRKEENKKRTRTGDAVDSKEKSHSKKRKVECLNS